MVEIIDGQDLEEALQTDGKPIVVYFATDWCPYCIRLEPIIDEISREHAGAIEVYYINADDHPDLAEQYDIMTVPTVFVFMDGEIAGISANPRTKDALLKLVFQG